MRPYAADRVLVDTFVGRQELIQEVLGHSISGRSVMISAGRRTGKTMFLRTFERHLASKGVLSIYVDCQSLEGPNTAARFVELVISESGRGVDGDSTEIPADMLSAVASVVAGQRRWCLIIDEIEILAQAPDGSVVLDNLRHLVSNSDAAGSATVVISGGLDLTVRLRSAGSSLANVCRPVRLPPLTRPEVGALVGLGVLRADFERVLEDIWFVAGGHPYIAQYFLESMPTSEMDVRAVLDGDTGHQCIEQIGSQIRGLGPLLRNRARQLIGGNLNRDYLSEVLVDAGLARFEGAEFIPNGHVVVRTIQIDQEIDQAGSETYLDVDWVAALLAAGESETVEFKESVKWDVQRRVEKDSLKYEVPQAVAAFMNSDGGTLLLGVNDGSAIAGLEPDIALNRRNPSLDGISNMVGNLLRDTLGGVAARDVRFASAVIDSKSILALTVEAASRPVYATFQNATRFFVRIGTTSVAYDVREAIEYFDSHW